MKRFNLVDIVNISNFICVQTWNVLRILYISQFVPLFPTVHAKPNKKNLDIGFIERGIHPETIPSILMTDQSNYVFYEFVCCFFYEFV